MRIFNPDLLASSPLAPGEGNVGQTQFCVILSPMLRMQTPDIEMEIQISASNNKGNNIACPSVS